MLIVSATVARYRDIALDLEHRIASGEFGPGDVRAAVHDPGKIVLTADRRSVVPQRKRDADQWLDRRAADVGDWPGLCIAMHMSSGAYWCGADRLAQRLRRLARPARRKGKGKGDA